MLWRFFANQDKKKKLKNIIGQKRVQIEGMTCEHCKNRVENALNRLEGVSAKVNLKKKRQLYLWKKR
jgi:copper chaperone